MEIGKAFPISLKIFLSVKYELPKSPWKANTSHSSHLTKKILYLPNRDIIGHLLVYTYERRFQDKTCLSQKSIFRKNDFFQKQHFS